MQKKTVCVITGSRAEYGLLYWVIKELRNHPKFKLQLVACGMHLQKRFGYTYKLIQKDGFKIDRKIETLLNSDTDLAVAQSIGLGVTKFSKALTELKPDLVLVLGDRFEIFSAVSAAWALRIPVAHIGGGDVTEGAFDEAFRHSMTKMSVLHFVTNQISKANVLQLGENPKHVFNVGNPGLDYLKRVQFRSRKQLESELKIRLGKKNILMTFHATTLEPGKNKNYTMQLLRALSRLSKDYKVIITKANADPEGVEINSTIEKFAKIHKNFHVFTTLGHLNYLSMLKVCDVVVGNSSSGILEAPAFGIPTVNIGSRQHGRLFARSVIQSSPIESDIYKSILRALKMKKQKSTHPYGNGDASKKITKTLSAFKDYKSLIKKKFWRVK